MIFDEQRLDEEQRQIEALEALWKVAGAGLTKEAALLAQEVGVGQIWNQHIQPRGVRRGKNQ